MRLQKQTTRLWLIAIILFTCTKLNAQWDTVGTRGFTVTDALYSSIDIGSNDTPFIAFRDGNNSDKVTAMKYNGSSWVTVGSAGFTTGNSINVNLRFDSNDVPYVSCRDGGISNKMHVMKYSAGSWTNVGTAGFSQGTASNPTLRFDSNDTAYVAYRDGGFSYSNKARVMKYNGSSWVDVGTAGFSPDIAYFITLALTSTDTPYVAFADNNIGKLISVMKYNGSSWVNVGSAGFSTGIADYTYMTFDNNDVPYVAYADRSHSSKVIVKKYNGSSWVNVGTSTGITGGSSGDVEIRFNSSNEPIIFFDYLGTGAMKYNGSSWVDVGSNPFSAGGATSSSFAIGNSDKLYAAFSEPGLSNKATVMEYTEPTNTWNGSTWSAGTPSSTTDVKIASNTAPATFACKDLTINSGVELNTGTSNTVTIHGDLTNDGNGVTGTGTLTFAKTGTATIEGDTLEHEGSIVVETSCTLATGNLLRLTSDASNTGRIGESAGTITGNVMAQRYSIGKRCYRLYAHPFNSSIALSQLTDEIDITGTGGAANGFTATKTNAPSAFWFDATAADTSASSVNSGWTAFTSANTASWDRHELLLLYLRGSKGQGLLGTSYTPQASTFEAAGVVNQGQQVVSLTKGANTTFAAVGNPFPSGVQMNTITLGANVGTNYYAWDASVGADGAYVTNPYTLSYILPAYAGFFTNISASTTITFEESDKATGGQALHKTTAPTNMVELIISDSNTKWDRLLINLDANAMEVEDKQDAKKLYNPNLDFYTLSKDGARLAVDVRPYADQKSIELGLTAYNRYNKYVIKTGMFDIPVGTKLILHDKYLNKKEELKAGTEYWFDVTTDTLSQGNQRFEINMVGKPTTGVIEATTRKAQMQLIPNPAHKQVKVSFDKIQGDAKITMMSVTGQVVYQHTTNTQTGSVTIGLDNVPAGIYIVELQSKNARFTEKLIRE